MQLICKDHKFVINPDKAACLEKESCQSDTEVPKDPIKGIYPNPGGAQVPLWGPWKKGPKGTWCDPKTEPPRGFGDISEWRCNTEEGALGPIWYVLSKCLAEITAAQFLLTTPSPTGFTGSATRTQNGCGSVANGIPSVSAQSRYQMGLFNRNGSKL